MYHSKSDILLLCPKIVYLVHGRNTIANAFHVSEIKYHFIIKLLNKGICSAVHITIIITLFYRHSHIFSFSCILFQGHCSIEHQRLSLNIGIWINGKESMSFKLILIKILELSIFQDARICVGFQNC